MKEQHFAVITADKQTGNGGGLSAHIDRQKYDPEQKKMVPYLPGSVTHPERTHLNKEYILSPGIGRTKAIDDRIRDAGIKRAVKKDQVKAITFICTSDHEKMAEIGATGRLDEWVEDNLKWFRDTFGEKNVVSAVLHMDETTPHLHITVVPIVEGQAKERKVKPTLDVNGNLIESKKRRYKKQEVTARLCAADVMKRSQMKMWQEAYPRAMNKWGMVRGIEGHGAQRVDPAIHNKQLQLIQENEQYENENLNLLAEMAEYEDEQRTLVKDLKETKVKLDEARGELKVTIDKNEREKEKTKEVVERLHELAHRFSENDKAYIEARRELNRVNEELSTMEAQKAVKTQDNASDVEKRDVILNRLIGHGPIWLQRAIRVITQWLSSWQEPRQTEVKAVLEAIDNCKEKDREEFGRAMVWAAELGLEAPNPDKNAKDWLGWIDHRSDVQSRVYKIANGTYGHEEEQEHELNQEEKLDIGMRR